MSFASDPPVAVIWHDVECGAYTADLEIWHELARSSRGALLDLGSGTGRVAIELAAAGADVTAVDSDPELLAVLERRARRRGVDLATVRADVRELDLGRRFALILAPMQLVHLLGGPEGRGGMLRRAASHLADRGRIAIALLADEAGAGGGEPAPLPDIAEVEGWTYSSLPIEVASRDGVLELRRLRQTVSPGGDLDEALDVTRLDLVSPDELESEAAAAGLRPEARLPIAATADHVGSTVVVFGRERD